MLDELSESNDSDRLNVNGHISVRRHLSSAQGLTIKTLFVTHATYVASQGNKVVAQQNRKEQMIELDVCLKVTTVSYLLL